MCDHQSTLAISFARFCFEVCFLAVQYPHLVKRVGFSSKKNHMYTGNLSRRAQNKPPPAFVVPKMFYSPRGLPRMQSGKITPCVYFGTSMVLPAFAIWANTPSMAACVALSEYSLVKYSFITRSMRGSSACLPNSGREELTLS